MLPRTEISKNHQLNDVVLDLQEGIPALDGYTGEDESGVRIVIQDFLFSASYRVGEQALLARPEDFGGIVFFDGANIAGTKTMTKDRAKNYTLQYLRHQGFLRDYGDNKYRDLHARLYLLGIRTAIYDTSQPALDGGLPLNAFEVKGKLTKSIVVLE